METICGIIGFIIGIVLFVLLLNRMHFLFVNFYTLMLIFTACVGVGCFFAYIFGWIFIIVLVIAAIYLLFFKKSSDTKEDEGVQSTTSENSETE